SRKQAVSVETRISGANSAARPQGIAPMSGTANYLLGSDPAKWRTGAPLYQKAIYRQVYPGVDLVFHGTSGSLEYDFIVQPGASTQPIGLDVAGGDSLRLESDGALVITTANGDIRWKKPEI